MAARSSAGVPFAQLARILAPSSVEYPITVGQSSFAIHPRSPVVMTNIPAVTIIVSSIAHRQDDSRPNSRQASPVANITIRIAISAGTDLAARSVAERLLVSPVRTLIGRLPITTRTFLNSEKANTRPSSSSFDKISASRDSATEYLLIHLFSGGGRKGNDEKGESRIDIVALPPLIVTVISVGISIEGRKVGLKVDVKSASSILRLLYSWSTEKVL